MLLLPLAFAFSLISCKTIKPQSYLFKNITRDTVINNLSVPNSDLKIKSGDILSITVSSLNKSEDDLFNEPGAAKTTSIAGYLVSSEGSIYLHRMGKITVSGLSRQELKYKLEKELQPYFKDPIVTVNFTNHHVTVLNGAGAAKIVEMPAETISLFEAMGGSTSSFENAKFDKVIIIRENESKKEIKHINLEDHTIFSSQWYYLQPNDVVVLNPDKEKQESQERRQRTQQVATLVLQGISIALIIYSTFR
ncbi:MAG: polysaccharide biosynthesis/export family protein [Ferruginibacter sp.]